MEVVRKTGDNIYPRTEWMVTTILIGFLINVCTTTNTFPVPLIALSIFCHICCKIWKIKRWDVEEILVGFSFSRTIQVKETLPKNSNKSAEVTRKNLLSVLLCDHNYTRWELYCMRDLVKRVKIKFLSYSHLKQRNIAYYSFGCKWTFQLLLDFIIKKSKVARTTNKDIN